MGQLELALTVLDVQDQTLPLDCPPFAGSCVLMAGAGANGVVSTNVTELGRFEDCSSIVLVLQQ